jgi:predicted PhzF superfamily epimerase YddE/YHI9
MSIAEANSSATAMIQVDVFTDEPYTGNPAGVCILERSRNDIWMSRVAREMAWRTLHVRISTVCVLGARARVFPAKGEAQ